MGGRDDFGAHTRRIGPQSLRKFDTRQDFGRHHRQLRKGCSVHRGKDAVETEQLGANLQTLFVEAERVNDFATRVDLSLSSGFHAAPFFSGGLIQTASGNSGGCGGFLTKRWGFLA